MVIKEKISLFRNLRLDYVIIGVLVLMSGLPVAMGPLREEVFTIISTFFLVTIFVLRRKSLFTARFLVAVSVLSGILIIQCITFDFWPFHTMIGFMLRLFIGYAAIRLVSDFPKRYVIFIYYLCIVSLCFHSLAVIREATGTNLMELFGPIDDIVKPDKGINAIIHHFHGYGRLKEYVRKDPLAPWRNGSCFWEPGVLAAYTLLAIAFLGLMKDKFDKRRYRNIFVVLVISLLTTMSTTGYVLLPLCLLFHLRGIYLTARYVPKILGLALLLALFCTVAYHLDFVGEKIEKQFDSVAYREAGWEQARIGSLVYDLEYIRKRPFFGWGPNNETRHALSSGVVIFGHGNGLSDFTVRFGLFGLVTVLTCIWVSFYQLTNRNWMLSILFVLFVVMVLNGERLLNYSTYLGLMFLGSALEHRHIMT